ncbi:MAG: rhodanese-like domain-containing protein [Flavobacteriales bacterium]|nr:rhodanese-like domain-containing protein [Flavobacteriales bacterium]
MQSFIQLVAVIWLIAFSGCNKLIYNSPTVQQLPKEAYLAKLREVDKAYVLDIRTRMEYKRGHIEGAESMSVIGSGFDEKIELLDTTRTVFVYCETAHRSPIATMKLKRVGFTRIYDLEGGYSVLRED